ncbi:hypothetical protein RvY_18911 [Ramazzottius varieornatus]|uniref:Uncharacterized protein n=1 Tax=Ramazzottius varieornatus TaxID=947166 RepID=A0A1D1W7I2_RAMVA|nr:hypothetical protein RvY_18911 [Ramazzottius varieornatus]
MRNANLPSESTFGSGSRWNPRRVFGKKRKCKDERSNFECYILLSLVSSRHPLSQKFVPVTSTISDNVMYVTWSCLLNGEPRTELVVVVITCGATWNRKVSGSRGRRYAMFATEHFMEDDSSDISVLSFLLFLVRLFKGYVGKSSRNRMIEQQ